MVDLTFQDLKQELGNGGKIMKTTIICNVAAGVACASCHGASP
jgi:hypothetical protein